MTYEVVYLSGQRITVRSTAREDRGSGRCSKDLSFTITFTATELKIYEQLLSISRKLDNQPALIEFWKLTNTKVSRPPKHLGLPAMQVCWAGSIVLQWRIEDPEIDDITEWTTYTALLGTVDDLLAQIEEYQTRS